MLLLFMLVLLLLFDSTFTPDFVRTWILNNKITFELTRLVHVNAVFLGAAVFSLVFNTGFRIEENDMDYVEK